MNKNTSTIVAAVCLLLLAALAVTHADAQSVPALINYQGKLVSSNGLPVSTGDYQLRFRIYDAATNGNLTWGPQVFNGQTGPGYGPLVSVVQGWFNVILGPMDTNGIAIANAFTGTNRFMEIQLGTSAPFSPRQQILSAPFALRADFAATATTAQTAAAANSVSDGSITGAKIAAGAVGSTQLGAGAVQASNIAAGAVGSLQVSVGAIGSDQIAAGAIGLIHIAPGTLTFFPQHIEVFTSSGIWIRPTNVSRIYVKVWGAGGGGGGGFRQFNGGLPNYGGGGGGGYSEGFLNVTTNATIVIGAGGAGYSGFTPASPGGTSSIVGDITIQASGGSGGGDLSSVASGGAGSGGLQNLSGTPSRGSEGGSAPNPQYDGAVGGGRGTSSGSPAGVNDIGGRGYGGGGAGGAATSGSGSGSSSTGGTGANGLIIIYY